MHFPLPSWWHLCLPMPGELPTAPGLLPFLVALSLMFMALGLGASAVSRTGPAFASRCSLAGTSRPICARCCWPARRGLYRALQLLAFQTNFSFLGFNLKLSAFEPVDHPGLATLIHISWRGPIWITTSVSIFWALTFRWCFRSCSANRCRALLMIDGFLLALSPFLLA